MHTAAKLARAGDRLVSMVAAALIVIMLLFGGYSLWDTAMVFQGAFLDSDLLQFKPAADGSGDNPTLAELQAINPDVVGWLSIDDTHIDYPVVIGDDDMEYVNKDIYGDFALSGSIFLDSDNARDISDPYTLVYGHHMDNGAMFGDVVEFVNTNYFEAHPTGTLYLPNATYSIELFACLEVDAFDSMVYDPLRYPDGNVSELLNYIDENAVQSRYIGVTPQDKVIGLSTCAEAETNGRVVIFGRLDRMS